MGVRFIFIFIFLFSCSDTNTKEKFDIENHDAFLGAFVAQYFSPEILIENNGIVKEWIEIDLELSSNSEIIGFQIKHNSGNSLFNQAVLDKFPIMEKFIRPKKVNGKAVSSNFKYRSDSCFDSHDDNGDAKCIEGQPKLLKSTVKLDDNNSKKKVLIYFQQEVSQGVFKASKVAHQEGDFVAIQVEKNISLPFRPNYAKKFGFNTLKNKELLSFNEFFEAYYYYINWNDPKFTGINGNYINPETFNEHKPLTEKTQYWTTRPKSARPQFKTPEHLFSNYYAELDAINYTGAITLKSHVEPTVLLTDTTIVKGSGIDRLDEITLKVLERLYITPAYKNYQNEADDIEFEINFHR